jgi:hypothetical protein
MTVGFGLSVYSKVTAERVWTQNAEENILTEEGEPEEYLITSLKGSTLFFNNYCQNIRSWEGLKTSKEERRNAHKTFNFTMKILYHILQTGRYATVVAHLAVTTLPRVHHLEMDLRCTTVYRNELETKLPQKPWRQETANTSDWPRRKAVAEFPIMRQA